MFSAIAARSSPTISKMRSISTSTCRTASTCSRNSPSLGAQVTYAERENDDAFPVTATDPDNSDTQNWWGFSPKAGLLWEHAPDVQSFVNVSRSFEPPSFGELGNAANGGAGLGFRHAEQDLKGLQTGRVYIHLEGGGIGRERGLQFAPCDGVDGLARAGAGIAALPCFIGDADPQLARIIPEVTIERSFWLVTHQDTRRLPRIEAFVVWLTALVKARRSELMGTRASGKEPPTFR